MPNPHARPCRAASRCYVCGKPVEGARKHPECVSRFGCDWEGCDRHPALGDLIIRVSPKPGPFVGLCEEHYHQEPQRV